MKLYIKPEPWRPSPTADVLLWRRPMALPLTEVHEFDFNRVARLGYTNTDQWRNLL